MTTHGGELPFPYSIKRHGVTITNCDAEPVQTPGCVQSHGVLMALRPADLVILQVSENSGRFLGAEPAALLGRPVEVALGAEAAANLRELLGREALERNPLYAFTTAVEAAPEGGWLDVTVHTVDGVLLVELEQTGRSQRGEPDYYRLVRGATARLQAAPTLEQFCQAAAEEVFAATGLDRVMIYRFLDDGAGQVVAEALRPGMPSWLGLRYPAEDIPRPAREIFKKIGVRPLPDAQAGPVEIVPLLNPDTGRPLDMTHCALRGASVMYTEYLQNMGVRASLTTPLLRDGELWGLIAGHNQAPAVFPYQIRAAAELLSQIASLQLRNAEDREHLQYRGQIDTVHHTLLAQAAQEGDLAALMQGERGLLAGIEAGGAALYHAQRWYLSGATPSEARLDDLAVWLRATPELNNPAKPVFSTDFLAARYAAAAADAEVASGLLAVSLSRGSRSLLLWFRPEQVQTFKWGGDPYEKPTVIGPHGPRLTPRRSFEIWQEEVRGRAVPWRPVEVEAALRLRYLVMDLVVSQAEQLAALNSDLARSNEELDAFAYVASHDLKEPLRGIHKYAYHVLQEAQAGGAFGEKAQERLEGLLRLTLRMDGLLDSLLHYSRVGRLSLEYEETDLGPLVVEAIEMLGARVEESGAHIRLPRPLPQVRCDRVRVREIFANLVSNALKYNDKPEKWIEIGYIDPDEAPPDFFHRERVPREVQGQRVFYVRDNGIGIEPRHHDHVFVMFRRLHSRDAYGGGSGAGLTITRKLVEQHRGRIWLESALGEGAAFFFTLDCVADREREVVW